ncbi:uncharacterized protein EHS24_001262 [Apiotrichum porosum]|uniref:Uncharacterized protein n=1 Tax=Apiotrichum porosum TaxID=105984 RepID=A0A427XKA4_9TREE|nr:uncharacterized protein EHS24_001262 [Apiotrichum porosum]RSH79223.1 hypothetical protein EHS24_001262 [Apiotrichum porosum]
MSSSSSKGKGKASAVEDHSHDDHDHSQCGGHHDHGHSHAGPSADDEEPNWPVVTAEEIEEDMEDRVHFMNKQAIRRQSCISDLAGMDATGMGIHRVVLPAGRESTVLHSHLAESEWIYILAGSGTLVLARPAGHRSDDLRPPQAGAVLIEEVPVKTGDFAGFPAGTTGTRWAHKLRAGNEDIHYLLGGDRKNVDVITYPTEGKTLLSHEESGGEAFFTATADEAHALADVAEEDDEE